MGRVHHPFVGHIPGSTVDAVRQPSNHIPPQQSGPKTRQSTRGPPTDRPKQSERLPRGGRPCCGGDSSAGRRGFAGRGQPRCGQFEDHARRSQGPDPSCPSRRMIGCMLEVHRACEEAFRECRSRCDKAQEVRASRETELSEGLANLQRLRSEATSAAPVPPVVVGAGHGHFSGGDASEESQDPQCPVSRSRGDGLCNDAVGQSRRSFSSKGSEHVDVNADQRG